MTDEGERVLRAARDLTGARLDVSITQKQLVERTGMTDSDTAFGVVQLTELEYLEEQSRETWRLTESGLLASTQL